MMRFKHLFYLLVLLVACEKNEQTRRTAASTAEANPEEVIVQEKEKPALSDSQKQGIATYLGDFDVEGVKKAKAASASCAAKLADTNNVPDHADGISNDAVKYQKDPVLPPGGKPVEPNVEQPSSPVIEYPTCEGPLKLKFKLCEVDKIWVGKNYELTAASDSSSSDQANCRDIVCTYEEVAKSETPPSKTLPYNPEQQAGCAAAGCDDKVLASQPSEVVDVTGIQKDGKWSCAFLKPPLQ